MQPEAVPRALRGKSGPCEGLRSKLDEDGEMKEAFLKRRLSRSVDG